MSSGGCIERIGNGIETSIYGFFSKIGNFIGNRPKVTIALSVLLTVACGAGFTQWTTESRPEKLWVPQDTQAELETELYTEYFDSNVRFNNLLVQAKAADANVLTKEILMQAMEMHYEIQTKNSTVTIDGVEKTNTLLTLCAKGGFGCSSSSSGNNSDSDSAVCSCALTGILGQWNFDKDLLEQDDDILTTLNQNMPQDQLLSLLGKPTIDSSTGLVTAASALTLSFFLEGRLEIVNNAESDPINDAWEETVFLATAESVNNNAESSYSKITVDYIAARSFGDEFGSAITGDLALVNISYIVVFLFLGATLGKIVCGTGSRWTMSLAALVTVGLSVGAGFGVSSLAGLFFGPVHSLLPFILIGIGVDDAFVIVNAFNRERSSVKRSSEDNATLAARSARALGRAGASITVTSATDLVAFAISSMSALPALASFCGYAAICIFFLWLFASTFFTGCMVLDERRQRDHRRECLCFLTRKNKAALVENDDDDDGGYQEGFLSRYFRKYHAPLILSSIGKIVVLAGFAGLFGFGVYGAINLPVEDTQRAFIPSDSYVTEWLGTFDENFPSAGGIDVAFVFEDNDEIYKSRNELASLHTRLAGKSTSSPWIAEPVPAATYRNVLAGYKENVGNFSSDDANAYVELGDDGWPTSSDDFVSSLRYFLFDSGYGSAYVTDVAFGGTNDDNTTIDAIQILSEYVGLTKQKSDGSIIDDADRQIDAMDDTRTMVEESWTDLPEQRFVYSEKFIAVEGFKVIKKELFLNVGLALCAVAVIVLLTVASPVTALLITVAVAMCLVEILGFMFLLGIAIDSVSVINLVLAVGLSVDYSAHVGHCFMVKGGSSKNERATEALADIGAAVLSGATSTFLAVVVLLFSSSYVFSVLSKQFALTVGLGVLHGLVLLPVLLSIFGPKPFASAADDTSSEGKNKALENDNDDDEEVQEEEEPTKHVGGSSDSSSSSNDDSAAADDAMKNVEIDNDDAGSDGSCSC